MRETKITCDMCGKVTKGFDVSPVMLDMLQARSEVTVTVSIPLRGKWTYDLCRECQAEVYKLIKKTELP